MVKTEAYSHPSMSSGTTTVFDGEVWQRLATKPKVYKLTNEEALADIAASVTTPDTKGYVLHHATYINPNAHQDGSNYLFLDGHAAKMTLDKTLDPSNYMWGDKVYSIAGTPVINDNP